MRRRSTMDHRERLRKIAEYNEDCVEVLNSQHWVPAQFEIAIACRQIQETWSPEDREKRSMRRNPIVETLVLPEPDLESPRGD